MDKKKQEIILLILFLAIFLFAGLNSTKYFFRMDLSENKAFTISKVSKNLFKEIGEEIKITYYVSEKISKLSNLPQQIEDLLYEYSTYSRGKIKVIVSDPAKEELTAKVEELGILPQQIEVLEKNEKTIAKIYSGILIEYLDTTKIIPFLLRVENLEYELTSGIRSLIKDRENTIGIIIGDDNRSLEKDYNALKQSLEENNSIVEIKRGEDISATVNSLMVLGNKDFDAFDLFPIDQFIMNGGNVLFCAESVNVDMARNLVAEKIDNQVYRDFLMNYGLELGEDLVLDKYSKDFRVPRQFFGQVAWQAIGKYAHWISVIEENASKDNPVSSRFSGLDLLWPTSLREIKNENIKATVMFKTTNEAWLMKNNYQTNPYQAQYFEMFAGDNKDQYNLAYSLEGTFKSFYSDKEIPKREGESRAWNSIKDETSTPRIMVIADTDFLTNVVQYSDSLYNFSFISNVAEWLASDEDLLEIKTRSTKDLRLNKIQDPKKKNALYVFAITFNIVIIPLLIIGYGVHRLIRRRKKQIERIGDN